MRYLVSEHDRVYEWRPTEGKDCSVCDLMHTCGKDIHRVCTALRDIVGSPTTHRFREVKSE